MTNNYKLKIEDNDPVQGINDFLKKLLSEKVVDALLVPQEVPSGMSVVQTLVKNEEEVKTASPFAPLLLTNSGAIVGQITLDKPKEKIGAVLRSCEIRAAIELAKLKQVNFDNLIVIGVDCMGTYEPDRYKEVVEKYKNTKTLTNEYLSELSGKKADLTGDDILRTACSSCVHPSPDNSDISISFFGYDINKEILIRFSERIGEIEPEKLGLVPEEDISRWEEESKRRLEERSKFRDGLFKDVLDEVKDISGFLKQIENCRRCYNCRKECPICYCRECIFESRTFEHSSEQYLNWAKRKGRIRMPSDTLLFHLTRMNHMVVSCVECGQCTSACPSKIPVAKFFKTIGNKVQKVFEYEAGRSLDEEIPQSTFMEEEFMDVGE